MKYLLTTLFATALLGGGVGFTAVAGASEGERHHGEGKKQCEYHKGGHHDGKQCDHHKGGHHGGHGYGHGKAWMEGLSDEQRKKIDSLHVDYRKKKHAIMAKMKDAKVALAKETIKDTPNQDAIYAKINDVVKLKATKLRLKAAHHINVRKLLTAEQRVKFDEHVVNKASKSRKHKGRH